jgi:hypothetical protein
MHGVCGADSNVWDGLECNDQLVATFEPTTSPIFISLTLNSTDSYLLEQKLDQVVQALRHRLYSIA